MKSAKSDTPLSAHLYYHWWKYVLLTVLSVLIWTSVFDTLAKPARNEKVSIVFFGDTLDTAALHADLTAAVGGLTKQELAYVEVSQTIADSRHLGQLLIARTYDCDLLILPAELVDQISAYGFFIPLPDTFSDIPKYCQETDGTAVAYGLEIYKSGKQNRFSAFCSGEQTYYVFLSKESVNLAGLNGNGSPSDDAALQILTYLLEEPYGSENEKSGKGL